MIISFAYTVEALVAGEKTCTRREWKPRHAAMFHEGDLVDAWSAGPHRGGRRVAIIKITQAPYPEWTNLAPDEDWKREGFAYMSDRSLLVDGIRPEALWRLWRSGSPRELTVPFHARGGPQCRLVRSAAARSTATRREVNEMAFRERIGPCVCFKDGEWWRPFACPVHDTVVRIQTEELNDRMAQLRKQRDSSQQG